VSDILIERAASVLKTTTGLKLVLIISKSASIGYCTVKKEVKYDEWRLKCYKIIKLCK
jgi:hypothetical protein